MPTKTNKLPFMLYADKSGRIFDHPYYRMAGFSGGQPSFLGPADLMAMPEYSKLFYIPQCPPIGLDPATGEHQIVPDIKINGRTTQCFAVAAFPESGIVRTHLPAVAYDSKNYTLPMWGYTAVGFKEDRYWIAGFRIETNPKWDPRNYDDRKLIKVIQHLEKKRPAGPLQEHLKHCALYNHCFAAKNLFLGRWEAPLPVSRTCNARCLGCLSLQPSESCTASHYRITFKPSQEEIVALAVQHMDQAPQPIVSFGQGCEGEPLTEYKLIAAAIRAIRSQTQNGTINLNTNGSWPERVRLVAESGLDSIRISLNSAQPDLYQAYYRPKKYRFEDVLESIRIAQSLGLYTMINYLVFPGITDQPAELTALKKLIRKTGLHFIHLKNLNIDPQLYLSKMPKPESPGIGLKKMTDILKQEFPDLQLGYFNQPVR
jgi:pyruvate-formate lyase-activating enzyme